MPLLKLIIHWGFLFIQLTTAILAICCWNKNKSVVWKVFIIVWVLTFLVEATGKIMGSYGIRNLWLYNIFFIIFYPGIVLIYAEVFTKSKWVVVFIAGGLVTWAIIYFLSGNHLVLNTFYITVAGACIIFLALTYLIRLFLDKEITTPLSNDCYYWFSTAFVIYFVFNAVMLGMYTKIIESKDTLLPVFIFYAGHLITLALHIFLWIGFRAALKWMK